MIGAPTGDSGGRGGQSVGRSGINKEVTIDQYQAKRVVGVPRFLGQKGEETIKNNLCFNSHLFWPVSGSR